jgi:hypothetical protein
VQLERVAGVIDENLTNIALTRTLQRSIIAASKRRNPASPDRTIDKDF